jgi:hypothetical protein
LQENVDFFLVTEDVYKYANNIYGSSSAPIYRYGITQADGETCIEMYLKQVQIFPVPAAPFNFGQVPKTLTISRAASISELKVKLLRCLSQLSSGALKQCKLWRPVSNNMDDILAIQKKYKENSTVDFDGTPLDTEETEAVENMALGPEDILLVELPSGGKFKLEKVPELT